MRSLRNVAIVLRCLALAAAPLTAAADDVPFTKLLDRTTRQMSAYLEQASNVTCTERVSLLKLAPDGSVQADDHATYDYFLLLEGNQDDLLLSESRLARAHDHKPPKNTSFLLTNGFSTLFLIFHPYYASSYHFEPGGTELIGGRPWVRVHFTPIPGARTPAVLAVRGREYPLELAGDAWIDPARGMVGRIEATLAGDLRDVGLRTLRVQVGYAPVRLPAWPQEYLFADTATVEVESMRQHWRNTHRFTDYKSFMVGTEENIADEKLMSKPAEKKEKRKKK